MAIWRSSARIWPGLRQRSWPSKAPNTHLPYLLSQPWQVLATLPRLISLSARVRKDTGGNHADFGFQTLLWGREPGGAGKPLDVLAMFASQRAFYAAIRRALLHERERRGEAPIYPHRALSAECIGLASAALISGSTDHRHFNRVGLWVAPYLAGSFYDGSYEVTIPVTAAVLAAVKPHDAADFALGR